MVGQCDRKRQGDTGGHDRGRQGGGDGGEREGKDFRGDRLSAERQTEGSGCGS